MNHSQYPHGHWMVCPIQMHTESWPHSYVNNQNQPWSWLRVAWWQPSHHLYQIPTKKSMLSASHRQPHPLPNWYLPGKCYSGQLHGQALQMHPCSTTPQHLHPTIWPPTCIPHPWGIILSYSTTTQKNPNLPAIATETPRKKKARNTCHQHSYQPQPQNCPNEHDNDSHS